MELMNQICKTICVHSYGEADLSGWHVMEYFEADGGSVFQRYSAAALPFVLMGCPV